MKISYLMSALFIVSLSVASVSFALTWYFYGWNNYCGDGILRHGEECDDGNAMNGDGCDRNCFLEAWFFIGTGWEILKRQDTTSGKDDKDNQENESWVSWEDFNTWNNTITPSSQLNILGVIKKHNIKNIIAGQIQDEKNQNTKKNKILVYPKRLEKTWAKIHDIFYLFLSLFGIIWLWITLSVWKVRLR